MTIETLLHRAVAVDTFQLDAETPQPGDMLQHLLRAGLVQRLAVVAGMAQGQAAIAAHTGALARRFKGTMFRHNGGSTMIALLIAFPQLALWLPTVLNPKAGG